jgi:tRNA (pseudouridine54-N1)-methyltransferase
MREFLLRASQGVTGDFSLNDLPGAGRMDLVCRCVTSALWLSDELRNDILFHVLLEGKSNPPKLITFDPRKIKRVYPDERNVASHIRIALNGKIEQGISILTKSFKEIIKENSGRQLIYLHQHGKDIRNFKFDKNVFFILGDHLGLDEKCEKILDSIGAEKVSIGPRVYMSSYVIAIVNNELDRRFE